MTFKQLEQFLRTEKWRAGTAQDAQMCGKYARCAYCDRFSDYPCARAYDTFIKKKRTGKAQVAAWQYPEPDVKEKFGTCFASEDSVEGVTRISINPEDLFYFSLGGRSMELYQSYYGREPQEEEINSYSPPALPVPAETEVGKYETGRRRFKVNGIVSLHTNDKNGTRVLVIRKRAKF
ncbi:MAG: hypothetical protein K2L02_03685 [Clostridia bacterium]|nr:hypothetical protein [Clostridia bacterium]